ncbi:MAG TPA: hypothetical protein VFV93_11095 [Thermomicrobiales bacterium]|nr:hypothetical protein [Thermomicrobiales bacterium]
MRENTIPERPPEQNEEPSTGPFRAKDVRQEMPSNTERAGSDEIDIVDFQSMQSFPASDAPSWPSVSSEPPVNGASEQRESPETG